MQHAKVSALSGDQSAQQTVALSICRGLVIGLIAFLTVVDLFATQAILPSLAKAYGVDAAAMGTAVNTSTFGMAIAGLVDPLASNVVTSIIAAAQK